jgi:cytochrome c-type biogenesis protein CcmH/NrfG
LAYYEYEDALVAYRRASELEPANAVCYAKIGYALAQARRFEEALVAYHSASELEPANASHHVERGKILRNRLEGLTMMTKNPKEISLILVSKSIFTV